MSNKENEELLEEFAVLELEKKETNDTTMSKVSSVFDDKDIY